MAERAQTPARSAGHQRGGAVAGAPGAVGRAGIGAGVRTAIVGMSVGPTCGARDHAELLADALGRNGVPWSMHWLRRGEERMPAARSEVRAWTRGLAAELRESRADAVLLHYSVFAYSHRGLPLFVHPTLSALRRTKLPVITVMHEYAYPWGHGGWRGRTWAVAQRALLIEVLRTSSKLIVTTDFRVEWLVTRPWLPKRPVAVAPVFSNLPPPSAAARIAAGRQVIGLFGYSYEGAAMSVVLDALCLLRDQGSPVQLLLLGAPGRSSSGGERWRGAAHERGLEQALSFSGMLPAQELSDALASCDLLLSIDPPGPTSRKTTLAASLASGRAVVALDGPHRWAELERAEAARVVAPNPQALAAGLAGLLGDEASRDALGARGRDFAAASMSVEHCAELVAGMLGEAVS